MYKKIIWILSVIFVAGIITHLYFRIKTDKEYRKFSYVVEYNTLIYNYTHFYKKITFEEYLKLLKKNNVSSCVIFPQKLNDFLSSYNDAVMLRGLNEIIYNNKKFKNLKAEEIYLIVPEKFSLEGLPEADVVYDDNFKIYKFNESFKVLNSFYIKFPVPDEDLICKYLKVFRLYSNPVFGTIDSYVMLLPDYLRIDKTLDFSYKYNKLHYFRKHNEKRFVAENFRAVFERNVKFVFIKDIKNRYEKIVDFLPLIKELNTKLFKFNYLKSNVFFFQPFKKNFAFYAGYSGLYSILIFILSFFLHKVFFFLYENNKTVKNYLFFLSIIILSGIFISMVIFNKAAYINSAFISLVKINLLIPFISVYFAVPGEIKKNFLNRIIRYKDLFIIAVSAAFILLLLIRSGNYNMFVSTAELKFRSFLESGLIVRPRFKEMFFYPFLFILFFNKTSFIKENYIFLYGLSLVAVTSTFNSFLHIHTPIIITLVRTFYGILIGSIIGMGINFVLKRKYA